MTPRDCGRLRTGCVLVRKTFCIGGCRARPIRCSLRRPRGAGIGPRGPEPALPRFLACPPVPRVSSGTQFRRPFASLVEAGAVERRAPSTLPAAPPPTIRKSMLSPSRLCDESIMSCSLQVVGGCGQSGVQSLDLVLLLRGSEVDKRRRPAALDARQLTPPSRGPCAPSAAASRRTSSAAP
jgi:hypothetical protein